MDLREAWKKLEEEKLNKPVMGTITLADRSKHPVAKLILGFKAAMAFILVFLILFVYLLVVMPQPIVKIGLAVVVVIYLFFFFMNLRLLRRMIKLYNPDQDVRTMLEGVHSLVTKALAFQLKISWGFFPICAAAGFFLGMSLKADAAQMIVKPKVFISLLTTMAVITPASYFLTKWLHKLSHGKYLKQIVALLNQMDDDTRMN